MAAPNVPATGAQIVSPAAIAAGQIAFLAGPQMSLANCSGGTYTAAAGAATVANANVTANSIILITLKTVGGTVAAQLIATITPGTGFTTTGGGSDTSTYNYLIIG